MHAQPLGDPGEGAVGVDEVVADARVHPIPPKLGPLDGEGEDAEVMVDVEEALDPLAVGGGEGLDPRALDPVRAEPAIPHGDELRGAVGDALQPQQAP